MIKFLPLIYPKLMTDDNDGIDDDDDDGIDDDDDDGIDDDDDIDDDDKEDTKDDDDDGIDDDDKEDTKDDDDDAGMIVVGEEVTSRTWTFDDNNCLYLFWILFWLPLPSLWLFDRISIVLSNKLIWIKLASLLLLLLILLKK